MSHFAMLVIGDDHEKQLQPFHEYECTGMDDEYVVDVDITKDAEEDYKNHKDDNDKTFLEFVEGWYGISENGDGKYGRIEKDNFATYGYRVIDRTNPNKKWDWWQVGGRWTGFYKLKNGADGGQGKPGLMTDHAKPGYADMVRKSDIDVEGMMAEAAAKANETYTKFEQATDGLEIPPKWSEIREKHKGSIDAARDEYSGYEWVRALRKAELDPWHQCTHDYYCVGIGGRERFVRRAQNDCMVPFGFLRNGQWVERGDMGWWGIVSDEKDKDEWVNEFMRMFNDLPDDTLLTIVDCHI